MATFTAGDLVPYGNSMVELGIGYIPEPEDHCKGCGNDFELKEDEDEAGNPIVYVEIPVDLGKLGKFCSAKCQWQAAYEAATPAVQESMRELYKALQGLSEATSSALTKHLAKWDEMRGPYAKIDRRVSLSVDDLSRYAGDLATQFDAEGATPWTEGLCS